MPEEPTRRVTVTFEIEEDLNAPWDEESVMRYFYQQMEDVRTYNATVERIEFPDGKFGDVPYKDIEW